AAGRHPARARLDLPGLALMALVIVGILVVLRSGLGGFGLAVAGATVGLAALLVVVELRTERPAIDIRLIARPSFAGALAGVFGATVVLHGCFLIVPLLVEELLNGSARTSGFVLLGIAGVSAIVAPYGGRVSDRRGRRAIVIAGSTVVALGVAGLATPIGTSTELAVGLLLGVVGLGLGLSGSPRQAAAFDGVAADRVGMAAGTYYTARYLGGVLGASLGGAVLGGAVTAGGVSLGFGLLAVAAILVAMASLALPARGPRSSLPMPLVGG
ncbi:MAG: MFS transporter, partial [Chloroflexi bacterium]|nr:MFS transporter [Chloroflexota bacterium]